MKLTRSFVISVSLFTLLNFAPADTALGVDNPQILALSGRLKSMTNSDGHSQNFTARLYFPKTMKKPVLVAYVDGKGNFTFSDLPTGDYLLEIYANNQMIYQKAISLNANFVSDDSVVHLGIKSDSSSWTKVFNNSELQQRHIMILQGNEFQGRISVYVGDVHSTKSFSIIVFKTGDDTSRWQAQGRVEENELRRTLGRDRIINAPDDKLSHDKMRTGFSYNGHYYSLDGTKLKTSKIAGDDYLYFEIWRKP
ncbi:MAG: hypothetical protein ACJ741_18775 [Pyrinomonadaceae bacterium]